MGVTGVEKSDPACPLCRYCIPFFWCFLAPSGTHLGGLAHLLTLIFQHIQSRRLVWNNKIKKIAMGQQWPKPLK
jgi:hypothetical protein